MQKLWYDERLLSVPISAEVRKYWLSWWDKSNANGELTPVQKVTVGA